MFVLQNVQWKRGDPKSLLKIKSFPSTDRQTSQFFFSIGSGSRPKYQSSRKSWKAYKMIITHFYNSYQSWLGIPFKRHHFDINLPLVIWIFASPLFLQCLNTIYVHNMCIVLNFLSSQQSFEPIFSLGVLVNRPKYDQKDANGRVC